MLPSEREGAPCASARKREREVIEATSLHNLKRAVAHEAKMREERAAVRAAALAEQQASQSTATAAANDAGQSVKADEALAHPTGLIPLTAAHHEPAAGHGACARCFTNVSMTLSMAAPRGAGLTLQPSPGVPGPAWPAGPRTRGQAGGPGLKSGSCRTASGSGRLVSRALHGFADPRGTGSACFNRVSEPSVARTVIESYPRPAPPRTGAESFAPHGGARNAPPPRAAADGSSSAHRCA